VRVIRIVGNRLVVQNVYTHFIQEISRITVDSGNDQLFPEERHRVADVQVGQFVIRSGALFAAGQRDFLSFYETTCDGLISSTNYLMFSNLGYSLKTKIFRF